MNAPLGGMGVDDVNSQTCHWASEMLYETVAVYFRSYWRPRYYRLADSPLAYRVSSTDFRAKERLPAVYEKLQG